MTIINNEYPMHFSRIKSCTKEPCKLPRLSDLSMLPDPCSRISIYPIIPSCCNTCISYWITTCSSSSFQLTLTLTLILTLTLTPTPTLISLFYTLLVKRWFRDWSLRTTTVWLLTAPEQYQETSDPEETPTK